MTKNELMRNVLKEISNSNVSDVIKQYNDENNSDEVPVLKVSIDYKHKNVELTDYIKEKKQLS